MKRHLGIGLALAATAALAPSVAAEPATSVDGRWYAGDLHVHTVYSHDAYGGPTDDNTGHDEAYTLGWTVAEEGLVAGSRGLDFVAITDHNDVRAQADPGWGSQGVIWVPGYENSLGGHAQMLGATEIYEERDRDGDGIDDGRDVDHDGDHDTLDLMLVAGEIRSDGGLLQMNHPDDGDWLAAYGYGFVPDSVEVWNIGAWLYQPPLPATNDHEIAPRVYDRFLDEGHRLAATGGSDSHWRSTTAAQGVGQPTTWVFAEEPTWESIVEGIDAGRTTISHQPPAYGGAVAHLSADEDGDGVFESMVGDEVRPGSALRVEVTNAPGAVLRLVTDGSTVLEEVPVSSPDFQHDFETAPTSTWVRAEVFLPDAQNERASLDEELCGTLNAITGYLSDDPVTYCRNRVGMLAMTSAIYLRSNSEETVAYTGDRAGRVGRDVSLAATVTRGEERPAGVPVTFSFQGTTVTAHTGPDGIATISLRALGPPGPREVVVSTARAGDRATITITSAR